MNKNIEIFKIIQRIIVLMLGFVGLYLLSKMITMLGVLGVKIEMTYRAIEALKALLERSMWF